jgi:hypothetical protein
MHRGMGLRVIAESLGAFELDPRDPDFKTARAKPDPATKFSSESLSFSAAARARPR